MKQRIATVCLLTGSCLVAQPFIVQAQQPGTQQTLTLARDGKSAFKIVYPQDAPTSVKTAAQDLQRYIQKTTKAKLPLLTSSVPQAPFISVGATAAAKAAGVTTAGVPVEGFRMVTRNGNIFILGPDTADGASTLEGGTSNGTSNGVYAFIENYLNVRWLLPGEMGEDVPSLKIVTVPNLNRTEAPFFLNRRVPGMQNNAPAVQEWSRRHKLGFSMLLNHAHNWHHVVPPEMHAEHPDWFPEIGGKRSPVVGDRYKLETTNPGLIQHYADTAIKAFRADPNLTVFSLSPTDSANWSESAGSKALYDKDPHGDFSVTPLVLKFYNDVAKIVGKEFPDRKLAGYVYAQYLYPPSTGVPPLEPNLFLVVAPSISYGYQLFRLSVQKDWDNIMSAWASQTSNISYYDLFSWLRGNSGAITPPVPDILNFAFPRLVKYKVKGVYVYGTPEWSQAAVNNYVLSKMAWNPRLDARKVTSEFYYRAYGQAAGTHIERLYDLVEKEVSDFYNKDLTANYTATPGYMKDVLADNYSQIEALYLAAEKAAENAKPAQRARLRFFGDNLMLMQWQLRGFGFLPDMKSSPLYRTDGQIERMMGRVHPGFGVTFAPGFSRAEKNFAPVRAEVAPALRNARPITPFALRGSSKIMFFPTTDAEVQVTPVTLRALGSLVRYDVYDASGKKITGGPMRPENTIRFPTSASQIYYMEIDGGSSIYELDIKGAPYAIAADPSDAGVHFNSKSAPLYFRVPAGVRQFTVTTSSGAPGETSVAELYSPSGKLVQKLSTQTTPVSRVTVTPELAGENLEGFWVIHSHADPDAPPARFDDAYVAIDPALPQWFTIDPAQPLAISPLETR
jgi:hypothetical protein